jgi:hypothetical protein
MQQARPAPSTRRRGHRGAPQTWKGAADPLTPPLGNRLVFRHAPLEPAHDHSAASAHDESHLIRIA